MPVEICVALINELNAMSPAQPISMWMNIPHMGLSSMDSDYSAASNWGVKAVDIVFNGSTVGGIAWSALTSSANLFLEFSNETWNGGGDAFSQSFYLSRRGFLRWPQSGTSDAASMTMLRSSVVMDDIRQSNSSSRIKSIIGCWGTKSAGNNDINDQRMGGTTFYSSDATVTGNPRLNGVAPLTYPHDYICFAGYIDANLDNGNDWDNTYLSSLATSWVSNIGNSTAQEANCQSYVDGQVDAGTAVAHAGPETIGQYLLKLAAYSTKAATFGATKRVVEYEGGWDHALTAISSDGFYVTASQIFALGTFTSGSNVITGVQGNYAAAVSTGDFVYGYGIPDNTTVSSKTSNTITLSNNITVSLTWGQFIAFTPQQAFLRAVKRSAAWSTAYRAWLDAFAGYTNAGMPSDYIVLDRRWGHVDPDAYGFGNTEWGYLDQLLQDEGTRNRALPA